MSSDKSSEEVVFKSKDVVGFADAESDAQFLENCFVATGDLDILQDYGDPRCIILGRTGSGKTALINRLLKNENCFELFPETLSLDYIANSNVIGFFQGAGVNLDPFYRLLWNHVIATELLKRRYNITNEKTMNAFVQNVLGGFKKDKPKEQALKYLREWRDHFWEETETKIKNLTEQIETKFAASTDLDSSLVKAGAEGAKSLTVEEKKEVVQRGTRVIDDVQLRALRNIINLLAEDIFNDSKQKYMIVIDGLDEEWAEDSVRLKLIKALMESIKRFRKVQNVKIVMALRNDLKDRVIAKTKGVGDQEEKNESLYLPIRWTPGQIRALLDNRVSYFFKFKYTKHNVRLQDIMPGQSIRGKSSTDFLTDRTFLRPRDAIIFFNIAIGHAEGQSRINTQALLDAETVYSQERLSSLDDEWRDGHPLISHYYLFLRGKTLPMKLLEIQTSEWENIICQIVDSKEHPNDPMCALSNEYMDAEEPNIERFISELISILYKTGIVGLKMPSDSKWKWSYIHDLHIAAETIQPEMKINIHPTFDSALGIRRIGKAQRG